MDRLTHDDDLFVRMQTALGLPVVNQSVWHLPVAVHPEHFVGLAERLRHGRLSRLVSRRRLPGRDRWLFAPMAGEFSFSPRSVAGADALDWARRQVRLPLDICTGPTWRLTAAHSTDGASTYVSLVVSHVVADGGAAITAVTEALHDRDFPVPGSSAGLVDDLRDSVDLTCCAAGALRRLIRSRSSGSIDRGPPATPRLDGTADVTAAEVSPTTALTFDADDVGAAATTAGGTVNTLFAAIMIGLLAESGRVRVGDTVPVSLPVSRRTPGDRRANATSGATAEIRVTDDRYADLTPIRTACREAYRRLTDHNGAVAEMAVIGQLLSDGMTRRLAANVTTPLCLASNLGVIPEDYATLGTGAHGPMAVRAVTDVADPRILVRRHGGLSGWLTVTGATVTLSVTSLDPVHVPDETSLRRLLHTEARRWNLRGRPWGA